MADAERLVHAWLMDGEIAQHSPATVQTRRRLMAKLFWLLRERGLTHVGPTEVRAFLSYATQGHGAPGGRWGNPRLVQPVRPRTVQTYYGHLKTFFAWCVEQRALDESPMRGLKAPICREDQINPFTQEQVETLLRMAYQEKISYNKLALRDAAIIWVLYDAGLHVSELCGLTHGDWDVERKRLTVLGKGNKTRSLFLGANAVRALWAYTGHQPQDAGRALFTAGVGPHEGEALTRYGVRDMIYRLNERAQLVGVRVSPHTFRHSFAIAFLRRGGTIDALQELMGHTDIKQTLKYKKFADADIAAQRKYSPGDAIKSGAVLRARPGDRRRGPRPQMAPQMVERVVLTGAAKVTRAKITEDDVRAIRRRLGQGEKRVDIAIEYGLSRETVKQLALGYTWGHVK